MKAMPEVIINNVLLPYNPVCFFHDMRVYVTREARVLRGAVERGYHSSHIAEYLNIQKLKNVGALISMINLVLKYLFYVESLLLLFAVIRKMLAIIS